MADAETLTERARVLLGLGRREEAGEVIARAMALDPTSGPAHVVLARIQLADQRLDEADATVRRALGLDPTVPALHIASLVARARGDHTRSLELLDRAIRIAPENAPLHVGRALSWLGPYLEVGEGDSPAAVSAREEACSAARIAAELDPDLASPHYALALAARGEGDLPGAAAHLQDAFAIAPDWADAHLLMGRIRAAQGMGRLASRHFAAAGHLDPEGGTAIRALRRLNRFGSGRFRRRRRINPFLVPEAQRILAADFDIRGEDGED